VQRVCGCITGVRAIRPGIADEDRVITSIRGIRRVAASVAVIHCVTVAITLIGCCVGDVIGLPSIAAASAGGEQRR
jgi:hypothetical protein